MPKDFRGGNTVEEIEARKKLALEEIAEMDKEIERLKAEEEQQREIGLRGLFNRVNSLIKTSESSFSSIDAGDIYEVQFGDLNCAESYMNIIDIEIAGRYKDGDGHVYHLSDLKDLETMNYLRDPTLVVSFLVPFDMINSDEFFISKLRQ